MAETQIGNAIKNVLDYELDSNLSIGQTGVSAKDGIKLLKNLAKDVMTQIKDNNYKAGGRTKITLFKTGKSLKETDSQKFGLKHIGDTSQPYELGDFGKRLNSIDDTVNMRKTINNILVRYKDQIGEDYDTYLQFSPTPASYIIDSKTNIDKKSVFAGQKGQLDKDTKSYDAVLKAELADRKTEVNEYKAVIDKIKEINTYETKVISHELKLKELEEKLKVGTKTNEELDEKIKPLQEELDKYDFNSIQSTLQSKMIISIKIQEKIERETDTKKLIELSNQLTKIQNEISELTNKLKKYNIIKKIDSLKDEKKKLNITNIEYDINKKKVELKTAKDNKNQKINELKTLLITNENILKFIFIAIGKELNETDKMSSLTEDNINEIIKPETLTKIENKIRSLI